MKFLIKIGVIAIIIIACTSKKEKEMKNIRWEKIDSIDASMGGISQGVSAAFAGIHSGNLVVAGGCNFPEKPVTEGGAKVFYKDILLLKDSGWKKIGELPIALAYGASVQWNDKMLFVGGNNADEASSAVYSITIANDLADVDTLATMPFTIDNFAAAVVSDYLFVFGGNQNGEASKKLWKFKLNTNESWTECSSPPSYTLVQPAMVSKKGELFVLGGFANTTSVEKANVSQKVWKYSPQNDEWQEVSELPTDKNNYSVSGGVALTIDEENILAFSGVNKNVFEDALDRIFYLANTPEEQGTEHYKVERTEQDKYMHHPKEWYKFNSQLRMYNTVSDTWQLIDDVPQAALAGSTIIGGNRFAYLVNGEIKPGIRTPNIWKLSW